MPSRIFIYGINATPDVFIGKNTQFMHKETLTKDVATASPPSVFWPMKQRTRMSATSAGRRHRQHSRASGGRITAVRDSRDSRVSRGFRSRAGRPCYNLRRRRRHNLPPSPQSFPITQNALWRVCQRALKSKQIILHQISHYQQRMPQVCC